jgi:hypothetical protein
MKKRDFTVFLWNMMEDVLPFVEAISDPSIKAIELNENDPYSDREVYSMSSVDVDLYITPKLLDPGFLLYVESVIGKIDFENRVPKTQGLMLCRDVLSDKKLLKEIIDKSKKRGGKVILRSYSASPQFLELVLHLRSQGLEVETPEAPEESNYWTTNFFGSKSGIRQLVLQEAIKHPYIHMPLGFIGMGVVQAVKMAFWFYNQGGVVLKTNKGHSGAGVLIFAPRSLPNDYPSFVVALTKILMSNSYWEKFPIIVEAYILPDQAIAGGNPNVEFYITPKGQGKHLFTCGMRVDRFGTFEGVEIGAIHLPKHIEDAMVKTGQALAYRYAQAGYRGYFDIDFIFGRDKQLYLAESNVRRTGGTYVYNLAQKLFGRDGFKGRYFASTVLTLPRIYTSVQEIITALGDCVYSPEKEEGIVIMSHNLLGLGKFMYVVIAKSKLRALRLEARMKARVL